MARRKDERSAKVYGSSTRSVAQRRETHSLEVVERHLVAKQVQQDVLERAGVSVRENEAVSVDPQRVGGVAVEELACGARVSSQSIHEMQATH